MRIRIINPTDVKTSKPKKRVCAYARVSTDSNSQAQSLENQTETYERLIKSNPEYEFAGIYHDKAITGSKEERPGFMQMISDAREGKFDLIIVKSISRFARNTAITLKYLRELKSLDIGIFFEEENINTLSEDGEMMISVLSSFAQEELESISKNIKWSVQKRFRQGMVVMSTKFLLGYDKNEYGELVVNEEQAKIVKRIFDMYVSGIGTTTIAKILNSEGIPTIKNKKWISNSVCHILKNEKYKGDCRLQKTYSPAVRKRKTNRGEIDSYYIEGDHQPIVSPEIWDKAQEIMEKRRIERNMKDTDKYKNRYPLSRLLICPYCGSALIRQQVHNKRIEWWCGKSIREGIKACPGIHVRDEDASAQNITEPTIVKEELINGKKCYSYTRKSELNSIRPKQKTTKTENGSVLPSVHRPRRAIIKL